MVGGAPISSASRGDGLPERGTILLAGKRGQIRALPAPASRVGHRVENCRLGSAVGNSPDSVPTSSRPGASGSCHQYAYINSYSTSALQRYCRKIPLGAIVSDFRYQICDLMDGQNKSRYLHERLVEFFNNARTTQSLWLLEVPDLLYRVLLGPFRRDTSARSG